MQGAYRQRPGDKTGKSKFFPSTASEPHSSAPSHRAQQPHDGEERSTGSQHQAKHSKAHFKGETMSFLPHQAGKLFRYLPQVLQKIKTSRKPQPFLKVWSSIYFPNYYFKTELPKLGSVCPFAHLPPSQDS